MIREIVFQRSPPGEDGQTGGRGGGGEMQTDLKLPELLLPTTQMPFDLMDFCTADVLVRMETFLDHPLQGGIASGRSQQASVEPEDLLLESAVPHGRFSSFDASIDRGRGGGGGGGCAVVSVACVCLSQGHSSMDEKEE